MAYKLHAIATRPGFSHNIQAVVPVFILRSLTRDALEYQQTLDIENTWPEKLMYAITLPHKAWAAGDTITAIVKLSPLAKGIYIQSIESSIVETTKISTKAGSHETTRAVASVMHEIIDRQAVEIEVDSPNTSAAAGSSTALGSAGLIYPPRPVFPHIRPSSCQLSHHQEGQEEEDLGSSNNDVATHVNLYIPPSSAYPLLYSVPDAASPTTTPPRSASPTHQRAPLALSTNSMVPLSHLTITPSHGIEPILISHRIAWKIFIRNSDGHVSQLKCSLPIKVLDGIFLDESREFTRESRRLLFRMNGLGNVLSRNGEGSEGEDYEGAGEEEGGIGHMETDRELPSYPAHVRDRVANMYLPEAVTMRVSNPWVGRIRSPGATSRSGGSTPEVSGQGESDTIRPLIAVVSPSDSVSIDRSIPHNQLHSRASHSGRTTPTTQPLQQVHMMSQLPHAPGSGESAPLDWVNSELLLSLSLDGEALRRIGGVPPSVGGQQVEHPHQHQTQHQHQHQTHSHNQQHRQSRILRWGSRVGSTAGSRAGSPERNPLSSATTHNDNGPSSPIAEGVCDSPTSIIPSTTGPGSGFASPFQNLFKATIKPFTNLTGHRTMQSGSRSTPSLMGLHSTSATVTASGLGGGGRPLLPSGSLSGASPVPSSMPSPAPQNETNDFISTSTSSSPSPSLSSSSSLAMESTSVHPSLVTASLLSQIHLPEPQDTSSIVLRAFTVVPDYSIASRGFIGGGVPPLSSMRGLPSYEEAEAQRMEREAEMQSSSQTSEQSFSGSKPHASDLDSTI